MTTIYVIQRLDSNLGPLMLGATSNSAGQIEPVKLNWHLILERIFQSNDRDKVSRFKPLHLAEANCSTFNHN